MRSITERGGGPGAGSEGGEGGGFGGPGGLMRISEIARMAGTGVFGRSDEDSPEEGPFPVSLPGSTAAPAPPGRVPDPEDASA